MKRIFWGFVVALMMVSSLASFVMADEDIVDDDLFAEIIAFVVDRDPVLQGQKNVITAARRMDTVDLGDGQSVPAYAQGSLLQMSFDNVSRVQQTQQLYTELERRLVTEVLNKLTGILSLRATIDSQNELYELLSERLEQTERQVQAGIVQPTELWELSERLINFRTSAQEAQVQLLVLEREIAFNYGGDQWQQLLALLQNLR